MLSHVWLFATLWTVSCQATLLMGFFGQRILELVALFPSPEDLPYPGIEPESPKSPAFQG